jgi:Tol biopolymer transport system component
MRFVRLRGTVLLLVTIWFWPVSTFCQDTGFGQNKVQYRNFEWSYIQTNNFDIYYYPGGYELAKFAAQVLEDANKIVSDQLRYQLRKRVPIIIYQSPNEFQQTNVVSDLIEENVGGFTEAFKNRVVIPFNGSYEDFRHVLHHELTHALIFDMLYGNILHSLFSPQTLFNLPLWFSEGYAEFSSRHGMDYQGDMVLRDASVNNYLVPLPYLGGYLAYKEGQSVLTYVTQRYGEEKIHEILTRGRGKLSFNDGLKAAIGLTEEQLNEEWQMALKKIYWPELAKRKLPKEFAKQLTFHDKDGSFFNEKPVFSPQADRLALFSDRRDYTEIIVISTIDGRLIDRVVKGERSGDLESLHSYVSGMSWSPDGKSIAFVSKSKGEDALYLVNVPKKKIYKKLKFGLSAMFSPAWSPEGNRIVFAGVKEGKQDLYLYNLETKKLDKLTDDVYSDADPGWSPNGDKLVFSSDRPHVHDSDTIPYQYGHNDLFLLNLATTEITPLSVGPGINRQPAWSPKGDKIAFVSNRNGIDNIYIYDLDSNQTFPVTNVLTGCFNPSWSKEGDQIAFSSFYKGGWDVFVMKEIRPQTEEGKELELTSFQKGDTFEPAPLALHKDTLSSGADTLTPSKEEKKGEFTSYVFKSKDEGKPDTSRGVFDTLAHRDTLTFDTLAYREPSGEFKKNRYKLKFTPDLVAGAFGYDPFFGLRGQSFLALSDIMGGHNLLVALDLYRSLDQSNLQFYYNYAAKRTDYSLGGLYTNYLYIDEKDRLFRDRVFGILSGASRPFSKFLRLDWSISFIGIDREYELDNEFLANPLPFLTDSRKIFYSDISLVKDNVLWGITGPINGNRYKLTFEYAPQTAKSGIAFRSAWLDYRRYFHFARRFNFAFRITGGSSWGSDPRRFFLGGISNWIAPDFVDDQIYSIKNLYFSGFVTPLRGFDYFQFSGKNFGLFNFEFRYPFIERLAFSFPLSLSLSRVTGVWFIDAGSAWDENSHFKGVNTADKTRLEDIHSSFGFGARANLGFLILRFDTAWATDLASVNKPRYYFSLGADF